MPCRSPLTGYRTPDGKLTFGERSNSLGRFGLITLRCGVCRDCRLHHAREWAIRCYHETAMHDRNCWLTLTFETDPVTISKRDLQIFFKRLRNAGKRFRYFACGEYGDKLSRPHYHVCLFGTDFPDAYPWKRSKGGLLSRSPTLERAWTWGHALIAPLTLESAGYTARYTMKKIKGDLADEHYKREYNGNVIDVHPEFQLQSRGLGLEWIQKNFREVFPRDHVIYKGKECPVPRFYVKWLEANEPKMFEELQVQRKIYYDELEYETGKSMHQKAVARDSKTKTLNDRNLQK
ncbi:replication initiator protein [Microviridae sp.]|nr:replication initiator protein [Microviridae sp.]